ncbi:unnamed protein product [Cyprideis torosa]|uniref:Uncharacterized protein n=1 Tax=Cyprideis torosa TaxID=163714 RepID=A0A7R8WCJ6_9CRUS|nr:unnamed protein product [Cyprideis torosa]CAG0888470.1 unnamed protein product [Cyprideis torosa]
MFERRNRSKRLFGQSTESRMPLILAGKRGRTEYEVDDIEIIVSTGKSTGDAQISDVDLKAGKVIEIVNKGKDKDLAIGGWTLAHSVDGKKHGRNGSKSSPRMAAANAPPRTTQSTPNHQAELRDKLADLERQVARLGKDFESSEMVNGDLNNKLSAAKRAEEELKSLKVDIGKTSKALEDAKRNLQDETVWKTFKVRVTHSSLRLRLARNWSVFGKKLREEMSHRMEMKDKENDRLRE